MNALAYQFIWPLVGSTDPEIVMKYGATRRRAARETPFILHAQIANSAGTRLHVLPLEDKSRALISQAKAYHERQCLDAVTKVLESTGGIPSDPVILALTLLTWLPGPYEPETNSKYPISPMAESYAINQFLNMELTPAALQNIQTYFQLIELRGGLNVLQLPGQVHAVILYVRLTAFAECICY